MGPLPSRITTIISRWLGVLKWLRPQIKHRLLENTVLTLYRLLASHFLISTQLRLIPSTKLWPNTKYVSMGSRAITSEQSSTRSLTSSRVNVSCSEFYLLALFPTLFGLSGKTRSTVLNSLSPFSISCDSVCYQNSVSYTPQTALIVSERLANAVSMVLMRFTCDAGTEVPNMSSSLGIVSGRGRTAFSNERAATGTWRLIGVDIAGRLSVRFLVFLHNSNFPLVISFVSCTSLPYKTFLSSNLDSIVREFLPHFSETTVQSWRPYLFHPSLSLLEEEDWAW